MLMILFVFGVHYLFSHGNIYIICVKCISNMCNFPFSDLPSSYVSARSHVSVWKENGQEWMSHVPVW